MSARETLLTKIVATVGPSLDLDLATKLAEAGVSVFRLNFSHGTLEDHGRNLDTIREAERRLGRPLGVLGDLSGPKMRIGQVVEGGIDVSPGQDVVIQRDPNIADGPRFSSTYPELVDDVEPGQKVLVNDGAIRMLVVEQYPDGRRDEILCRVIAGGRITSGKGINLPNTDLTVEAITEKDWRCLEWTVEQELDFVALSFVRRAADITRLRQRMRQLTRARGMRPLPIVAKIERPEALQNLEQILEVTDVMMVARGDLGVEMDLAEVPTIQKRIIDLARYHGVPCIVATQMLESMISSPVPTRAEASDVANAILDGADAVMLSGETAVGAWPVVAVDTMARIARSTEAYVKSQPASPSPPHKLLKAGHWTAAVAHGAWSIARDVKAEIIVAASQTGVTAVHLSQNNFRVPLAIVSNEVPTLRRITVLHGVVPIELPLARSLDDFTRIVDDALIQRGLVERGAPIILLTGHPIGRAGATNSLAVHYVGNPETGFRGDA